MSTKIITNRHPVQDVKPSITSESKDLDKVLQDILSESKNKTSWYTDKVADAVDILKFRAFTEGLIPGFRIKEFLDPTIAAEIAKDIKQYVEEYKTAPGVGRAGETLVEHPNDFLTYAKLSAILKDKNISIPHRVEMADKILGYLSRNTDYQYRPLKKGEIELFWGLFRQINSGAGWHLDNVSKDSTAFKDSKVVFQGSAVLHIKTPRTGGETIMSNRRAQNGDNAYLNADGWTYNPKMLDGIIKTEVPAVAGDLVFLSTVNYHKVNPCYEVGAERISFSMFFVIFEDEPNTMYYYN